MFNTSTQKKRWTFDSQEAVDRKREEAIRAFRVKDAPNLPSGSPDDPLFFTLDDEKLFLKIVTTTSLLFGEEFKPPMWPSVKWMAQCYFKRFFLRHSALEYSPKNIVMACFYVAAKVEEFNVSIDEFLRNFKTGTPESNMETTLNLEPVVMQAMDYDLIIHTPYRAFEGHMLDMKRMVLGFNLEDIRLCCMKFFQKAMIGDAMFLYPPSQLALAGLKYGLDEMSKHPATLQDFLKKLLNIENEQPEDTAQIEKILARLDDIIAYVVTSSSDLTEEEKNYIKNKFAGYAMKRAKRNTPPTSRDGEEDSDEE